MVRIIYLFAFLMCCSMVTSAQVLVLREAGHIEVKGQMTYWRDATGNLTLEDVRKISFKALPKNESLNLGFDRAAHWSRIEIQNESSRSDWLLEVAYAPLDQIDFYIVGKDGSVIHKVSGDHFPIAQRDIRHRHPIFAFSVLPGESTVIFIRVETISSVQLPFSIWHREAFSHASYNLQLLNGFFYGAMLLMVLYQLFLFFSVRDKITFYYVLTLLTMMNVVSFFQGYTFLYFYPERPFINDILAMITGPAFVVCSTLLTRAFLNLRKFSKLLDSLLLGNMFLDLFVALLMTIFYRKISFQYHNYIIFLHCLLALSCAGYCLYKKYKPARYYLIAWFTLLVAAGIFTISSLGFMPGYLSTNYTGLMAGCILQMLFISFALGDRLNELTMENQRAKEAELRRGQEENERLEREVQLRVEEIETKSKRLEEVNMVKDKLFSVVSHDIRGPLASLQLALSLIKSGTVSHEEFQELSVTLANRFNQTTEFIENLLQWATLQLKGETFEPVPIDLTKVVGETVSLLGPDARKKEIHVQNNIQGSVNAFADLNMIRSVMRNLLTNAIKFTGQQGTITLNTMRSDLYITVSVSDTGVGIPPSNRDNLFSLSSITTPGTKQEKGTGLGLLLCREFVEKNGGRIWFESEEGRGTTFYFSLPINQEKRMTALAG